MTELIPRPASSLDDTTAETKASPELLTVPEACDALRISKGALYRLIHDRELTTLRIGRRRLVPRTSIRRLVDAMTAAEEAL
jgi:excisionase family DNA binding protein